MYLFWGVTAARIGTLRHTRGVEEMWRNMSPFHRKKYDGDDTGNACARSRKGHRQGVSFSAKLNDEDQDQTNTSHFVFDFASIGRESKKQNEESRQSPPCYGASRTCLPTSPPACPHQLFISILV